LVVALACSSSFLPTTSLPPKEVVSSDPVRIALVMAVDSGVAGGAGHWRYYDARHEQVAALGPVDLGFLFGRAGTRVRITRGSGQTGTYEGAIVLEPTDKQSFVTWNQKRYRGQLVITPTDSGLLIVNRLGMEEYLRGVVPLEIGKRRPDERAAVEAQAVAARSYSFLHLTPARSYDMVATVQDQVYGGVDAETPLSDSAVASTAGVVVKYAGRVISTPYHSTCGGSTAAVHEVWYAQPDEPYLRPVSDRIPGTDRFYCDSSPRFKWTTTFDRAALRSALEKYLWAYTTSPRGAVGRVTGVYEQGRTESGRIAALSIQTDQGNYTLKGNDIRFVLRDPSGTILNSTYFTPEATVTGGEVSQLTISGRGYGHGIGMCQWGAIGRARAGQDYKTILATYYPGTTIGRM
jgi:stage II sporulation protein D